MLTLMDRYILKHLLDNFLLNLVVFTLVLFFSDALFDFMKDLQHYGIQWDIAMSLIGLQLPAIIAIVLPISALMATLLTYSHFSQQMELVAIRMSGVSLYRLTLPAVILGVMACLASYAIYDFVRPLCNTYTRSLKLYAIYEQNLPTTNDNVMFKEYDKNERLKRLLFVTKVQKKSLGYTTVVDLSNPKTIQVTQAQGGQWEGPFIGLNEASVYTVSSTGKLLNTTQAKSLKLENFLKPDVKLEKNSQKEMSFVPLFMWIQSQQAQHKAVGRSLVVSLWEKLSMPLSALPLTLIAVPLAISPPRQMKQLGFLWAILTLFFYYLSRHLSVQLGQTGVLP